MSKQRLNLLQKALIWLAGKDVQTAELCNSGEVNKLCTAGTMVAIPALLAVFSWGYAFNLIFDSIFLGAVGGIVGSIIILLLDRGIMGYGKNGEFSFGMFGRVLLAFALGFLLAEPFILKIFSDRIDEHLLDDFIDRKAVLEKEYANKRKAMTKQIETHRMRLNALQEAYTQEMDGNGSPFGAGQGKIYSKKLDDYMSFKKWFDNKESTINKQKESLAIAHQNELEALEMTMADGLMGRLRALHDIAKEEGIVNVTLWLLRLTFLCIELIPLFLKITPLEGKNLYERINAIKKDEQEEVVNELSNARKEVITTEQKLAYDKRLIHVEIEKLESLIKRSEREAIIRLESQKEIMGKYLDYITSINKAERTDSEIFENTKTVIESFIADHMNLLDQLKFNQINKQKPTA